MIPKRASFVSKHTHTHIHTHTHTYIHTYIHTHTLEAIELADYVA